MEKIILKNILNEDICINIVDDETDANFITHSGTFHADEVMSTVLLLNRFGNMNLYRTNTINNNDAFIYDVGAGDFDHHGIDFNKQRDNGIKYASCGLIWNAFGNDIIKKLGIEDAEFFNSIDKNLIMDIDRDDNGQSIDFKPSFKIQSIPSLVSSFNPAFTNI